MAEPDSRLASEQEARDVAEDAREQEWEKRSFARALFSGTFDLGLLWPPPEPDPAEHERAREWLARVEAFSRAHIDGDAIDRESWVPEEVLKGLAELGAYGIKIPQEYGGLGFFPDHLREGTTNRGQPVWVNRRLPLGAPIHRRARPAHVLRNRGTEAALPPSPGCWCPLRLRAHRGQRRVGPCQHEHAR